MPPLTHFEVYALEGRGWTLQGRFVSTERDKAIDEAKSLESFLNTPTKVVREYHNPQTGMSDEHVIYMSPKIKELKDQDHRPRTGGAAGGRPNSHMPKGLEAYSDYQYTEHDLADRRYAKSVGDLLGRMLLVLTASLILAAMGTSLIPAVLNLLRVGVGDLGHVLFGIFMFLFLVSATLMGRKLVPLAGILSKPPTPPKARKDKGAPAVPKDTKPPKAKGDDDEDGTEPTFDPIALMDEHAELGKATAAKAETKPSAPDRKDAERKAREDKARDDQARADQERKEREAAAEAARKAAEKAAKEAAEAEAAQAEEEESSPEQDLARAHAMTFLGGAVSALKGITTQLDVFTRFGVNLYLAGACEALAGRMGLHTPFQHGMLREMLEVMGTRPALALMFIEKLEEYLMEPRYMQMVQAGREAMWLQLDKTDDPFRALPQIMADWNTPQIKKPTTSTIAIVFTDMVGSTDINSKVGDLLAREITRVHNAIVRSALTRFDGREVKHTGDGIMATFQVISQAAEAAVDIQRAVASHNGRRPDLAIDLRIGINAGEPVMEENDYYGIAVTLAARICAEAKGGDILCSGVIRDLSQGKDLRFRERGQAKLKGISDPQRLYEIVWDPSTPTTAEDQESDAFPLPEMASLEADDTPSTMDIESGTKGLDDDEQTLPAPGPAA
jgi:adenylate cyclase